VILIGSKKFINEKVFELKERQVENLEIIACYNYNEVKNDIKEIVSKYNDINKKDTNLANAFARGINGALKKMFSSDAPLIGQQHSS
jgi:hypothetical protein